MLKPLDILPFSDSVLVMVLCCVYIFISTSGFLWLTQCIWHMSKSPWLIPLICLSKRAIFYISKNIRPICFISWGFHLLLYSFLKIKTGFIGQYSTWNSSWATSNPKDDALKVLHSICQKIWKTQPWPQDWKRLVFIPIPKKGQWQTIFTLP